MSEHSESSPSFVKAFIPGLVVGLIVGLAIGVFVGPLLDKGSGEVKLNPKPGHTTSGERDPHPSPPVPSAENPSTTAPIVKPVEQPVPPTPTPAPTPAPIPAPTETITKP